MRRFAVIPLLLALCGTALAGIAGAQGTPPPLQARLATCQTGAAPSDRFAVFTGSMPAMSGATTLAMRFELFQRSPATSGFVRVSLPHWGGWEKTSRPRVPGFIFTKRVQQLAAPAAYRARLTFRWIGRDGTVLRAAHRTTPLCRQPDPRPDLHIGTVSLPSQGPAIVLVRNRGLGDAGAFAVRVSRAGASVTKAVVGLAAGDRETLSFRIGRCTPGEAVTVRIDPDNRVIEADEADNVRTVTCPAR